MILLGVETEFPHRYRIEDRNRENSGCSRQLAPRRIRTIEKERKIKPSPSTGRTVKSHRLEPAGVTLFLASLAT
jgi:hypothetical protein